MGVSKSQASLVAVRQDLDLSAAGSILERPVLNRVNKRSGPINLSEHKGVAMGAQLTIVGNWNDPPNLRYNGYKGYWPGRSGNPSISGDTIILEAALGGLGAGDASCEYRCPFKVTESGAYTLSGHLNFNQDSYYRKTSWQIAIVTSPTGYLSGSTTTDFDTRGIYDYNANFSHNVNLTTARPYGVVVLYAIRKDGGDPAKPKSYSRWTGVRITKT